MAFPPKKKDDPTTPDIDESETPEPAASTAEPDADDAGGMSGDAHLITTLSEIVKPLGIEVQVGPGMSLQDYVEHLCTAFKTHQATKGGDTDPADDPNAQTNPNNQQEPELPENAPIMMSTTAPTDREKKMAAVIMKQSTAGLTARIGVLFQRGFIDDAIRKELSNELGNIKLSMSDLSDDGTVKPNALSIQVAAYERQMKAGKPGPFAKTVRDAAMLLEVISPRPSPRRRSTRTNRSVPPSRCPLRKRLSIRLPLASMTPLPTFRNRTGPAKNSPHEPERTIVSKNP